MDPRIGILMREGKQRFYAFVDGYDKPETLGTLDEIEMVLGLRKAPRPPRRLKTREVRTFCVTVTPKLVVYSGLHVDGEYELEFSARTANEAIKQARQQRRDVEGAFAVPATYRARLVRC